MSKRRDTNWEDELNEDEIVKDKEVGRLVLLKGLQRLADQAGLLSVDCKLSHVPIGDFGVFQCIYYASFDDACTFVGAADCNAQNTNDDFMQYPTAVAESRAAARCLKNALGIRMLSKEEVGFNSLDVSPKGKIDPNVVAGITKLCDTRDVDKVDLIEKIIKDKTRARGIFELSALTAEEGQLAMDYLNEVKPSVRKERKKELEESKKKRS